MKDLQIILKNIPGELARMGEILGAAKVSLEGGAFLYIIIDLFCWDHREQIAPHLPTLCLF